MTAIAIDLSSVEYRTNPFPTYERLRNESPVHLMPNYTHEGEDVYVLSRYADVELALKDTKQFSSQIRRHDYLNLPMLVNRDDPDHRRLRNYTNRSFNARRVNTMGAWVQEIVTELQSDILSRDRVEFVEAYSTLLPLRVIGSMLGIQLDRKDDLRRWSQAVMNMFAVAAGMDPDDAPGFFEDLVEFGNYMEDQARERAVGHHEDDILNRLVEAHAAGGITRDELTVTAWSFVAAGHETTMNLLGGGVHLLIQHPELAAYLRDNPENTGGFVEEYLRLYSPTQWLLRRAHVDVELHGVRIPAGSLVHVILASANRDPEQFSDPETFNINRTGAERHFAFGGGPHFCPGTALSRLLADLSFRNWYPHIHRFSFDPQDPPRLRLRQGSYGYAHLPLLVSGR